MTVPSVSMKSDLGMAHPAPVNGGDLALGPDHVTLRHLAILLIALAAASHILQRERAPSRAVRSVPNSFTGSLISLQAQRRLLPSICAGVHRSPVPLESLQDRHQTWDPSDRPLSRSQRYMPHVSASRPH